MIMLMSMSVFIHVRVYHHVCGYLYVVVDCVHAMSMSMSITLSTLFLSSFFVLLCCFCCCSAVVDAVVVTATAASSCCC